MRVMVVVVLAGPRVASEGHFEETVAYVKAHFASHLATCAPAKVPLNPCNNI